MTKRYDTPKTPYARGAHSDKIPKIVKEQLKRHYEQLNPAALKRQIEKLQKQLSHQLARNRRKEAVA